MKIKTTIRILSSGTVLMIVLILLGFASLRQNQIRMEENFKRELTRRTYLDSLYWDHLSKCSMISNDEIVVDHRGYLYSKYRNEY
jgi:hypothetical protein